MKLSDTAIRRPVFAVMLVSGLVTLGLISIPRLGIDLFPRVEFPLVTVQTTLPGAAPETMEREVTQVIEESVNTIEGIRLMRSASSDSFSLIFVEFELEYDVGEKSQEVRDKVAAVRGDLPTDIEPPVVDKLDPDASPILAVMLAGPYAIRELSELADKRIKPRLERIRGVGNVTLVGARPREVRIWLDPIRLAGHGLAVDDVIAAVGREHAELPAGRIDTGRIEYALKTESRIESVAGFGDIVVAAVADRVIHLRDVATIEDGLTDERTLSRLNGERGVTLLVRRQSGENTIRVADLVKAELERIRPDLPQGYEMVIARDSSGFIRSSIGDVAIALAWGAFLAAAVVLVFLRSARSTLITGIAIPASLISSFAFFYLFGFTINTMTMMALSLSIGLLIDDAIVVLENIHRHMEAGEEPLEAGSRGTDEIGLAVIATTLSVCAVFVPIAFLSGVVGRFFREFGIVASCAVGISTLIALTLTPMLCTRFMRVSSEHGRVWHALERRYRALERVYRQNLAWGIDHRAAVVAIALAVVVAGLVAARSVPIDFTGTEDRSEFNIWLKMPLGTALERTRDVSAQVEAAIRELPEVQLAFTTVGSGSVKRSNEALIYTKLSHKTTRSINQKAIMSQVRERIAGLGLPLEEFAVENIGLFSGSSRHADMMYSIRGPDIGRLQYYAESLVERMRESGGYSDVYHSYEVGRPEIALDITRARAADLGVPAVQIGQTISALFAGVTVTTFEDAGERYDVRVQVRPEDRDDLGTLELVRVRSTTGALVPLRNLVTPRIGSGPVQIDREARTRAITVYGNLEDKAAGTADLEIQGFARELEIAGEYQFEAVGASKRMRETVDAILFAAGVALLAIYMILAAQFDSFLHPLVIMVCAPLSFVGAFVALQLGGLTLDVMGQIAFLMLLGIVMKNGILLVDYTNTLRRRGTPLREAAIEAGVTRMRPVLMTTVSTICGMLPVAFGGGDGSEWRNPMGMISIGGLTVSTLLTLVVVPVTYTLAEDARAAVARVAGALAAGRRGQETP